MLTIAALYGGLLGLMYVYLSVRTLQARRAAGVAIGDGNNPGLLRRIRVHANFAEYAPIGLLLLAMAETLGAHVLLVHALGASLVLGRLLHAFGVSQIDERYVFRVAGMGLTLTSISTSALSVLLLSMLGS